MGFTSTRHNLHCTVYTLAFGPSFRETENSLCVSLNSPSKSPSFQSPLSPTIPPVLVSLKDLLHRKVVPELPGDRDLCVTTFGPSVPHWEKEDDDEHKNVGGGSSQTLGKVLPLWLRVSPPLSRNSASIVT